MATPTEVQSVTVSLRSGVSEATLPDNRKMRANVAYAISLEDWGKISTGARSSIVTAPTFNTATYIVPLWNAAGYVLNLTTINNYSTLALLNADAQAAKDFVVGDVVRGFKDNAFKLVKVSSGSATVAAGSSVSWGGDASSLAAQKAFKAASTVTSDVSDVTDDGATVDFAGVAIGTITAGQYGWIQIAGTAFAAKVAATVDAGAPLQLSLVDEVLINAENEVQTLTLSSWGSGDTIKLTWDSNESSAVTYALDSTAGFQAAADEVAIASTAYPAAVAGEIVVTRTDADNYVFTFSGVHVRNTDVGAITATNGTGSATGSVAETNKGAGGHGRVVGTSITAADTGTANVSLRSALTRSLRSRSRDLFTNAIN